MKRLPLLRFLLLAALPLLFGACATQPFVRSERRPDFIRVPGTPAPRTVVFIHGMFMTPLCWERFETRFQAAGYRTLAPAWPEHEAAIEAQRQHHPDRRLAALTLGQVVDHYRKLLRDLPDPPILVGHSMGGLVVQLLLQEGLGAAGVAIDSAPPKGLISLRYSFLKSNWPAISPSASLEDPIVLSFADFQYAFVNGLPLEEQRAAFDRHVVPESRRVGKGPSTADAAIDFSRPRAPLLLISGGEDHIIPPSLNRDNFKRYAKTPAITDLREFPGRTHWIIAQQGWEEVADFALAWIRENQS